jgi:HEAT repeat protein
MNVCADRASAEDWESYERLKNTEPAQRYGPELLALLTHPYHMMRLMAAELMRAGSPAEAVTPLTLALDDQNSYVAEAAADALACLGTGAALHALKMSFASDRAERPHYLANALAKFGRDGFDVLATFVTSDSARLRYYASRGLGSTGLPECVPILTALKDDAGRLKSGALVATAAKEGLKVYERMRRARVGDSCVFRCFEGDRL